MKSNSERRGIAGKSAAVALSAVLALTGVVAPVQLSEAFAAETADEAVIPYDLTIGKVEVNDKAKSIVLHIDGTGIQVESGWWAKLNWEIKKFTIDGQEVKDFDSYAKVRFSAESKTLTVVDSNKVYEAAKQCNDKHKVVITFKNGAELVKQDEGYVEPVVTPDNPGGNDEVEFQYVIMDAGKYGDEFKIWLNEGAAARTFLKTIKEIYINDTKITDNSIFYVSLLYDTALMTASTEQEAWLLWKDDGKNTIRIVDNKGKEYLFDEQHKPDPNDIVHVSNVSVHDFKSIELGGYGDSKEIRIDLTDRSRRDYIFGELTDIEINGVSFPISQFEKGGYLCDIRSISWSDDNFAQAHSDAWNKNADNPVVKFYLKDKRVVTWPEGASVVLDKDKYDPKTNPLEVEQGSVLTADTIKAQVEIPEGSGATITNVGELPSTETVTSAPVWVPVTVTYKDSSSEVVNVSVSVVAPLKTQWTRLAGDNALQTMQKISQKGFEPAAGGAVVIASSEGYWDALSASSIAGAKGAPVLLSGPSRLSAEAAAEIGRLHPAKAFVVGGEATLAPAVVDGLASMGLEVERLSGQSATDTADAVAAALGDARAKTCVVASGAGYWDALSASPYAYAKKAPIFLTPASGGPLTDATVAAIKAGGYERAVVAGGAGSVSEEVVGQLKAVGVATVERVWGQSAYETSAEMASFSIKEGMSADGMGVATGTGYWDALAGAALCGSKNSVLLLADDGRLAAFDGVFDAHKGSVKEAYVFGGEMSVTPETWNHLIGK